MENLKKDFEKIISLIFSLEYNQGFDLFEEQAKNQVWQIYNNDNKNYCSFEIIFRDKETNFFNEKKLKISGGKNSNLELSRINFEMKNIILDKRQIKQYNNKIILFLQEKLKEKKEYKQEKIKSKIKDYENKIKELEKDLVDNL